MDANKYERTGSKEPLNFPVALRPSVHDPKSWTSIVAEDSKANVKRDFVMLHRQKTVEWGSMWFTILSLPHSLAWQIFVTVSCCLNYLVIMHYHFFNKGYSKILLFLCVITDIIYLIDVVLTFMHMYWAKIRLIMRPYYRHKTLLILDVISVLPIDYIGGLFEKKLKGSIFLFRMTSFLRLYRLIYLFKKLFNMIEKSHFFLFVIQYIVIYTLILHGSACTWFALGMQHPTTSWRRLIGEDMIKYMTPFKWYILCLYQSLSLTTNAGFGDLNPTDCLEGAFAALSMMIGFFLSSTTVIAIFAVQMVNKVLWLTEYTSKSIERKKYLKEIGADEKLILEIENYYSVFWERKNGVRYCKEINSLPTSLTMELMFDINIALLQKSVIFKKFNESFLRQISLLMENKFLLRGNVLFHQGVIKKKVVFISSGILEVLSHEDDQSPMISFSAGTVLNEASLILLVPAKSTVRAATYTELQVLSHTQFIRFMRNYPEYHSQIQKMILNRIADRKQDQMESQHEDMTLNLFAASQKEFRPIKLLKIKLAADANIKNTDSLQEPKWYKSDTEVVFREDYLSLYRLSENVTMIEPPRICLTSTIPWILEPNSSFSLFWHHMMTFMALFVCFFYPYYIVFYSRMPYEMNIATIILKFVFAIDLYIQCTTAVYQKGRIIRRVMNIISYKMNTPTFYLDVLAIYPSEYLAYALKTSESATEKFYNVFQLNRLLRIWRLETLFKTWEEMYLDYRLFIRITKIALYGTILSYWIGCLFYLESCFFNVCRDYTWYQENVIKTVRMREEYAAYEYPKTLSFYFGITITFLVGVGDILPENMVEGAMMSIALLISVVFLSYAYGRFCSLYIQRKKRKLQFEDKLNSIKYFLKTNKVPQNIEQRTQNYFYVQWYLHRDYSNEELMADAPWEMRSAVYSCELIKTIQQARLFTDVDMEFLHSVANEAKVEILPENEIITYARDMLRQMYILQKGECKVFTESGHLLHNAKPGAVFGDIEMLFDMPKMYTVRTTTICKVISIDYMALTKVLSIFPEVKIELENILYIPELIEMVQNVNAVRKVEEKQTKQAGKLGDDFKKQLVKQAKHSIVFVWRNCKKRGDQDNYWTPFKRLGKFRFVGFLLLPFSFIPTGLILVTWCIFRCICALAVGIFIPFYVATAPYSHFLDTFLIFLDATGWLDVYIMLHVCYYNKDGIMISHPLKTAKNYLSNSFLFDFLGVFPFGYFIKVLQPRSYTSAAVSFGSMARILQTHRIIQAVTYLEDTTLRKYKIIQAFKVLPVLVVLIGCLAAIMIDEYCNVDFYNAPVPERKPDVINDNMYGYFSCDSHGFFHNSRFENISDPFQNYLVAVYWISEYVTTLGTGDLHPHRYKDLIVCCVAVILGVVLFGNLFSGILCARVKKGDARMEFEENMEELNTFLKAECVDPVLGTRVIKYFNYVWNRSKGTNPQEICCLLNTALSEDTMFQLYEQTLREVPLFENVEKSFIRVIAKHLQMSYFIKGDVVIKFNDIQSNIYIIHHGKAEVLSSYNEMITCMGPGGLFGNINQITASCSSVSIVANRNLDVLIISSSTFYTVIKNYPKIEKKVITLLRSAKDYIVPSTLSDEGSDEDMQRPDDTGEADKDVQIRVNTIMSLGSLSSSGTSHSGTSYLMSMMYFAPKRWFRQGIPPEHYVFKFADFILLFVTYINMILVSYHFVTQDSDILILIICFIVEVFFYFNIILRIHQGYYDKYDDLELSVKKICLRHLKNKTNILFWIPNFPLEIFYFLLKPLHNLFGLTCLRLIHLGRFVYVLSFYQKWCKSILINHVTLNLIILVMWFILVTHFFCCIWILVYCPFFTCSQPEWLKSFEWTPKVMYGTSMYYFVQVVTLTGLGDFAPQTISEVIIILIATFTAKLQMALVAGEIATLFNVATMNIMNYERRVINLKNYLQNQNLSNHQFEKFWKYVSSLWMHAHGRQIPVLVKGAPYVLKCDIMSSIYGQHIRNSYIFKNVDETLLRQITVQMKHVLYFEGNYIIQHGDINQNMYFIHRGNVDVLTVHSNLTETIHETLRSPDVFGIAQGLFYGIPHHFSFRAQNTVDILVLTLNSWYYMLKFYPSAKEVIYERAAKMYSKL